VEVGLDWSRNRKRSWERVAQWGWGRVALERSKWGTGELKTRLLLKENLVQFTVEEQRLERVYL